MKKVIIAVVIVAIVIAGVIFLNKVKSNGKEVIGTEYDLNIKKEDAIYYEQKGSSSFERVSYIYYGENGECKIWTNYFNGGDSKTIEKTLPEETKEMILNKIENSIKNGEVEHNEDEIQNEGASTFKGRQYIDKKADLEIEPIDLVELNIVKDITDMF